MKIGKNASTFVKTKKESVEAMSRTKAASRFGLNPYHSPLVSVNWLPMGRQGKRVVQTFGSPHPT
jgi:hypothetical protein